MNSPSVFKTKFSAAQTELKEYYHDDRKFSFKIIIAFSARNCDMFNFLVGASTSINWRVPSIG